MNERIRELALQAGEYTNSVYTPPVRSKTPGKIWEDGHIDWHELYNEKFAKLIVRETIKQMAVQMDKFGDDQSNNPAWYKSEESVMKHFGVKE